MKKKKPRKWRLANYKKFLCLGNNLWTMVSYDVIRFGVDHQIKTLLTQHSQVLHDT